MRMMAIEHPMLFPGRQSDTLTYRKTDRHTDGQVESDRQNIQINERTRVLE